MSSDWFEALTGFTVVGPRAGTTANQVTDGRQQADQINFYRLRQRHSMRSLTRGDEFHEMLRHAVSA